MPAAVTKQTAARGSAKRKAAPTNGRPDNVSRAYEELRSLIVWGQLPPGARIAERAVADRLGLSRTPIRSALHRLQQEGFVASAGRGTDQRLIVAPLTSDDGQEVFLLVGHLEGLAARTAANLPKPERTEIVRRLRAINRELASESRKQVGITRIFDLDMEFHRVYVEEAAGPRVVTLHQAIKPQTERYVRLYVSALLDELPKSVKEHEVIASAIARGDANAAQRAVETNWRNAAIRLGRVIAEHGERGLWHSWNAAALPKQSRRA